MNKVRDAILSRLRETPIKSSENPQRYQPEFNWSKQQKLDNFCAAMRAVHTEVIVLEDNNWINWVNKNLPERKLSRVLISNHAETQVLKTQSDDSLQVQSYDKTIEDWKDELFQQIDVGITTTLGAIAETGSLILWPDDNEPRLMSLVPPVHIALLKADTIVDSFAQAIQDQNWATQMPTNALLISGPSKTADIEQTLAYGIHGPQQLIVLILP